MDGGVAWQRGQRHRQDARPHRRAEEGQPRRGGEEAMRKHSSCKGWGAFTELEAAPAETKTCGMWEFLREKKRKKKHTELDLRS